MSLYDEKNKRASGFDKQNEHCFNWQMIELRIIDGGISQRMEKAINAKLLNLEIKKKEINYNFIKNSIERKKNTSSGAEFEEEAVNEIQIEDSDIDDDEEFVYKSENGHEVDEKSPEDIEDSECPEAKDEEAYSARVDIEECEYEEKEKEFLTNEKREVNRFVVLSIEGKGKKIQCVENSYDNIVDALIECKNKNSCYMVERHISVLIQNRIITKQIQCTEIKPIHTQWNLDIFLGTLSDGTKENVSRHRKISIADIACMEKGTDEHLDDPEVKELE